MTLQKEANPQWIVDTGISIIWLGNDNIVRYTYVDKAEEDLEEAKKAMAEFAKKVPPGKRYPVLVDLTPTKSVTAEARAFHAGPDTAKTTSAIAIIVNSPVSKVIGNFFLAMNKPACPVRLVSGEEEGMAWLRTFL